MTAAIEDTAEAVASVFRPLKNLLPLFSDQRSRNVIDEFLTAVMDTEPFRAKAEIRSDVALRVFRDYSQRTANAARDLSMAATAKRETIAEDGVDLQANGVEEDSWVTESQRSIAEFFSDFAVWLGRLGFYAEIISDAPTVGWGNEDITVEASFDLPSLVLGLTLRRYMLDKNSSLTLFFEYDFDNNSSSGGASVIHRPGQIQWLSQLTLDSQVQPTGNGFNVSFNLSGIVALSECSNLELTLSATPNGTNPRASAGVTFNDRRGEGFELGINASANNAGVNNLNFFKTFNLNENAIVIW